MSEFVLQIPDQSLLELKWTEEKAGESLRMVAAVKLFE